MKMANVEEFMKELTPEKLRGLKKDEMLAIGRKLKLEVRGPMRKIVIMKKITEHMVNNNIFEEETLEDFLREKENMSVTKS